MLNGRVRRALPGNLEAGPEAGPGVCREDERGRGVGQVFLGVPGGRAPIYKPISPSQGGEGEAQRVKA